MAALLQVGSLAGRPGSVRARMMLVAQAVRTLGGSQTAAPAVNGPQYRRRRTGLQVESRQRSEPSESAGA